MGSRANNSRYFLMPTSTGAYATTSSWKNRFRKKINTKLYRSNKPNLAYLHIPKTGGTYIKQSESGNTPVICPIAYLGHAYVVNKFGVPNPIYALRNAKEEQFVFLEKDLEEFFLASTVRNIFSWLVSYFFHAGGKASKYLNTEHYDYLLANKGFDYFIKKIAERDTIWPNRKFIFAQLFADNGKLIVDWINRTETLDSDLEKLATIYGVHYTQENKQRVGHRTDYRSYYTEALTQLVFDTWGRELTLFGYEFDKIQPSLKVLYQAISEEQKENTSYFWNTDKFVPNLPDDFSTRLSLEKKR